uniref:Uncharacterized protein n=2 Tax=Cacopsylla melanoneura TaxID=428564 RepID=A0A8D8TH65_9HEMI
MEAMKFDSSRSWICLFTLMCWLSLGYSRYQEEGSDSVDFGQLFSKCVRFTPEFDSCVKDALNNAQDFFLTGVPELNLSPMDPWNLEDVHLNQTSHDLKFMNIRESSWRNSTIEEFKSSLSPDLPQYVQFTQFVPEYFIEGNFKAFGKQIEGFQEGKWNLTLYNMTRTLAISRHQLDPAKFKVKQSIHEVENMKVFVGDLPDATPSSENFDNLILNSFWKVTLPVFKPILEELLDVAYSRKYWEQFGNLDWDKVFSSAPEMSS